MGPLARLFLARTLYGPGAWTRIVLLPAGTCLLSIQLFGKLPAYVPGFSTPHYGDFVAVAIAACAGLPVALMSSERWISDREDGLIEQLLATATQPASYVLSNLVGCAIGACSAAALVLASAWITGAVTTLSVHAILPVLLVAALLADLFSLISLCLAVCLPARQVARTCAATVAAICVIASSLFLPAAIAPGWLGTVSVASPVNLAVDAARTAAAPHTAWARFSGDAIGLLAINVILLVVAVTIIERQPEHRLLPVPK